MTLEHRQCARRLLLAGCFLLSAILCSNASAHCGSVMCAPSFASSPSASAFAPIPNEDIPFVPGSYTFVIVPDTQKYSDTAANRDEFNTMMDWVVANKTTRNIQLLLHEGDITDDNDTDDWTAAKDSLSRLDEEVPYVLAQGNHDGNVSSTLMNDYFQLANNSLNGVGGINTVQYTTGEMQNTYSTLTAPDGRDFLIINLEYNPRQEVVDWADSIATDSQFAGHTAILLTHAYLSEGPADANGEPTPLRTGLGNRLWIDLVSEADSNFRLVLNGHYLDGNDNNEPENGPATTAFQADQSDDGELVYQIVANWQQQANGGNGYMRLFEFLPDERTIQVKTYSPTLDLWLADPRNQFTIDLNIGRSGDLNADGSINDLDWPIFVLNSLTDLSDLTLAEAILRGDMDGDMDNDLQDFLKFKKAYDLENGPGSFNAMIAGIPEPSSFSLFGLGVLGWIGTRRRHGSNASTTGTAQQEDQTSRAQRNSGMSTRSCFLIGIILSTIAAVAPTTAFCVPVNFSGYTVESYPLTNSFPPMGAWDVSNPLVAAQLTNNASVSVLYGANTILGERIIGTINPGSDDDIFGLVLGFNPGDTSNTSADYLLLDWKRVDQGVDFTDTVGGPFHDLTGSTNRPAGMRLSRVTGTPTADELWSNQNLPENTSGGVAQLGTAATLSATGYPTDTDILFDILYTSNRVVVTVDGVVEFDVVGSFPEGRLGLYSGWMGGAILPVYSNFTVGEPDETLKAIVNRQTGEIVLKNNTSNPIDFDTYQLTSAGGSLDPVGWNSLDDQNLDPVGAGFGQTWDESAGSNSTALMELFLLGSTILDPAESLSLGNAYDLNVDAQDLDLTFRDLPLTGASFGFVEYINFLPGDVNLDGVLSTGSGDPLDDDVAAFIAGWKTVLPEDDDVTAWSKGDLNFDRISNVQDAILLNEALINAGLPSFFGTEPEVPEPSTLVLLGFSLSMLFVRPARPTCVQSRSD